MKRLRVGLFIWVIFFLISSIPLVQAQTTKSAAPSRYDATEELTVMGTVSSVLANAGPGMITGSHLLLATSSGQVDASLGMFGLRGYGAVSVAAGQQIEATGVMKTIKEKPVLLVRTVKVDGEVYTLRNEHGVLLPPQARKRAGQKGESL
ncbi:MAG: hypothetical protein ABSB87_15355 [Terriglobales bacterium]|jgi:hypothetical protein